MSLGIEHQNEMIDVYKVSEIAISYDCKIQLHRIKNELQKVMGIGELTWDNLVFIFQEFYDQNRKKFDADKFKILNFLNNTNNKDKQWTKIRISQNRKNKLRDIKSEVQLNFKLGKFSWDNFFYIYQIIIFNNYPYFEKFATRLKLGSRRRTRNIKKMK